MKYLFSAFLFLITTIGFGQFSVAKIFSDNMVMQRDVKVPIWGWAKKGAQLTMIFDGQTYHTHAPNGTWQFTIPPHSAGKRYGLYIKTKDSKFTLKNITFGDVWLCGGESNMEWFVEASKNGQEEVQNANYPDIRLFEVPHKIAQKPIQDLADGQWQICAPKTVNQFSAVGYFFGREIHQELKIPIGLLSDNFGGTVIETWMSPDAFKDMPVYQKQIAQLTQKKEVPNKKEIESKFKSWIAKFSTEDKGITDNKYIWKDIDYASQPTMTLPTQWESAGIKELENMDGVIWFARDFVLSEKQAKASAALSLGPIDDSDITWINGIKVGGLSNQWNKNRNYTIAPNTLKKGKNTIVVRIEDYLGGGGIYGKANQLNLNFKDLQQDISLAGKWHYKIGYHTLSPMPTSPAFGPNSAPTLLYNGMIHPIKKFPIKGVIWYQGETNTYRAVEYKTLKIKWIRNWRKLWKNPALPMIWVQLANYQTPPETPEESIWAELREAQQEALSEPHTAMITAIDIGEAKTIHPINKQEVGHRLAQAALKEVYQKTTHYKSPRFLKIKKKRRKYIDIYIEEIGDGLLSYNKNINGFSIAGKDHIFHWATAKIRKKNIIRVYAPKGTKPIAIRYAWANNPEPLHITNSFGYPLLPFRTDNWKLSTAQITRQ